MNNIVTDLPKIKKKNDRTVSRFSSKSTTKPPEDYL
jgi:hypothetical protein